jgi:hypothetical protein
MFISLVNPGRKIIPQIQIPTPVHAVFENAYPSATAKGYAQETEHGKAIF